jgi:hypothetical protein
MKTAIYYAASRRFAVIIVIVAVIGLSFVSCDNPTGGGGGATIFTVTFDSDGGSYVTAQSDIASGDFATEPTPPTRAFTLTAGLWANPLPTEGNDTFLHWSAPGVTTPFDFENTPITGNITLTAQWTPQPIPLNLTGTNLVAAAVDHVNANPGNFTLVVGSNVTVSATKNIGADVHLTIIGTGGRRTITITRTWGGHLFNLNGANRSLTLGGDITLAGTNSNHVALVQVQDGAHLTMNPGAWITGNRTFRWHCAGGVHVTGDGSVFTMNGGEIFGNRAQGGSIGPFSAGGVRVGGNASFFMHGGYIRDNTTDYMYSAGGVVVTASTGGNSVFTMVGGVIRGNSSTHATNSSGGIFVSNYSAIRIVSGVTIFGGNVGINL